LLDTVARMDDERPAVLLEETQAASLWPHVYVEDVAAAIALAVTDDRAAGRVYNVGPRRTLGLGDWTRTVGEALGWQGEVVVVPDGTLDPSPGADMRHGLDLRTARIREELGFREAVSLADGIARTAEWERKARSGGAGPSADDYAREDAILASLQRA
jgi:nucleoside-diphosphate-sugar epimerase